MSLSLGAKTDVGRKRRNNQDSHVIVRGEALNGELDALMVVADGMGGRLGGEIASEIVVRTVPEQVAAHLAARNGAKPPVDTALLLEEAIAEAHRRVKERQREDPQLSGMGTTCVAAILDANLLTIANVGDSRAYLLRNSRLVQLTRDHSSVWEQVIAGNMTPDEARTSRFRNQITRSIGSDANARPDIETVELLDGDSILFCSDGLSSEIGDDEIARNFASRADPQVACEALVEAALKAGGRDNVTVVALRFGEFTPVSLPNSVPGISAPATDSLDAWRDGSFDETSAERQPAPRRRSHPLSPVLLGLTFLLAVVAGGEGYVLARLSREFDRLQKASPRVVLAPPRRPTDYDLTYGDPVLLSPKALRSAPLAADEEGGALAATVDGNMVRVDRLGVVSALPGQPKVAMPAAAPTPSLLLVTDVSGNRYQITPGTQFIAKYDAEGTLKDGAIATGKLVAPTALAVDTAGNLYVIDSHRLEKIPVADATPEPVPAPDR